MTRKNPHISKEWQHFLAQFGPAKDLPSWPSGKTPQDWQEFRLDAVKFWYELTSEKLEPDNNIVELLQIAGTNVYRVSNTHAQDNPRAIVYFHGGAYTHMSAETHICCAKLLAQSIGVPVYSIDYTLAPEANWQVMTTETASVVRELFLHRLKADTTAFAGDSSGGALAMGTALRLRDEDGCMPAAAILWSPWADLTDTGDTYHTLEDAEPYYTYGLHLQHAASCYAEGEDRYHPYVSPVYADYSKGAPATLIQGGTRELFLSNFVRLYNAIEASDGYAKLDLYEGMPHVFQPMLPNSSESLLAAKQMKRFFDGVIPPTK